MATRILIADDNVDAAESLATILRVWAYEVRTADGFSAVGICESFQPEIAILDINMPGMNGYTLARHLRSKFGKRIALIALTAIGGTENEAEAARAGFDHHNVKPAEIEHLLELLRSEQTTRS